MLLLSKLEIFLAKNNWMTVLLNVRNETCFIDWYGSPITPLCQRLSTGLSATPV